MFRSSLPLGRFFGVEVRMHVSFVLLLALAVLAALALHVDPWRGFGLWCALCFAVAVREVARSIAAACAGLRLRAVLLLPIGGVMVLRSADTAAVRRAHSTRWVTASGPMTNLALAALMAAMSIAADPRVSLLTQPWISLGHLLRSFIWIQVMLALVSMLPAQAMPSRQLVRSAQPGDAKQGMRGRLPGFGLGTGLAFLLIAGGFLLPAYFWLSILGFFLLLYVQVNTLPAQSSVEDDGIFVREVMLTEYSLLSSSDTLRGALDRTIHSLQEIFPVVRGDRLVGSISRQTIAERLVTDGDSYLQGAMVRQLNIASPDEKLSDVLRRAAALGASEFVPVVTNNQMVGILSLQSLGRALHQVKLTRPASTSKRDNPQ